MNRDFPGGPVVKNSPPDAGHMGSNSGRGTKISHTLGQLSLHAATREKPLHCSTEPTSHTKKKKKTKNPTIK